MRTMTPSSPLVGAVVNSKAGSRTKRMCVRDPCRRSLLSRRLNASELGRFGTIDPANPVAASLAC